MKDKGYIVVLMVSILIISGTVYYVFSEIESGKQETYSIPLADDTNATAESISSLVGSMNDFSFDFYDQIIEKENGNIFFSPYSIFVALSMAYEGSDGNTSIEFEDVLNFKQNNSESLGSFGKIYNLLNQNQDGYKISTANAFWAHQDYTFLDSYLGLLENFYMADANELDFSKNVEAAETINLWIEEKTNNKIKDMIDANMLSDFTKLVLTNAIYFKGLWAQPFDPDSTYEADFQIKEDEIVKVDMMTSDSDSRFNYTENEDLKVLKLNYWGNKLSMVIILPNENNITKAEA